MTSNHRETEASSSVTEMSERGLFVRFSELDDYALNVEHHVHTTRTDGAGTVKEVLQVATQRGIRSVAFTEHVRRETDWFPEFADEVRDTAVHFPDIRVLVGCEAKALDSHGQLDLSEEILDEVDIVLGSVHRIPDGRGRYRDFSNMTPAELAEVEQSFAMGLLRNAPIDVLAHPGGMYQRLKGPFPVEYFRNIFMAAREHDVAVEISSSYLRDPESFLDLCRELDPRVSVGSDVHRLEAIGSCRDMLRRHLGITTTA